MTPLEHTLPSAADGRGSVEYAFMQAANGSRELKSAQADADASFYRWQASLSPELEEIIRHRTTYVIPARNEGKNIHAVLGYLREDHRVPEENVLVLNAADKADDRTEDVVSRYGAEIVHQDKVIAELLDHGKFLDLLQASDIPRGKGLTLTCAWLHLLASGKIQRGNLLDTHVVCLDADPQDYAVGTYDPLTNFAKIRQEFNAGSIKPAKSRRNNQPVYVGENAIALMNRHGRDVSAYTGRMEWRLTGEMSRASTAIPKLVMSTGYPVETLMNLSDAELGLIFKQYADTPERSDGENPLEKETAMYTQIVRTRLAIEMWNNMMIQREFALHQPHATTDALIEAVHQGTYKKTIDYDAHDVRSVNRILATEPLTFIPDETNRVPKGVEVKRLLEHRLVGNVAMLVREKIAREIILP